MCGRAADVVRGSQVRHRRAAEKPARPAAMLLGTRSRAGGPYAPGQLVSALASVRLIRRREYHRRVATLTHPVLAPEEFAAAMERANWRAPIELIDGEVVVIPPSGGDASLAQT